MSTKTLDVVFDGPPGNVAGRFVEVEIDGKSVAVGKWEQRGEYWLLRIPLADVKVETERP